MATVNETPENASQDEVVDGQRIAAAILSRLPDEAQARIMERIATTNPAIAVSIAQYKLSFNDIAALKPQSIQKLLQEVERKDVVVSLAAASEPTKETILSQMTERARAMVLEEVATIGPVSQDEINAARHRILSKAEYLRDIGTLRTDPKDGRYA